MGTEEPKPPVVPLSPTPAPATPAKPVPAPAAGAGAAPAGKAAHDPDDAGFQDTPPSGRPVKHPATFWQKVGLTLYLFLWVLILLPSIWSVINLLNASAVAEVSIGWEMPAGVTLNPGPAAFRYDATQKKLVHYGVITAERKLELRALFTAAGATSSEKPADTAAAAKPAADAPAGGKPVPAVTAAKPAPAAARSADAAAPETPAAAVTRMEILRRGYHDAIDNLAYLANVRQREVISYLLILGALGGVLGAVLRSLVDFVGNACYTEALDLVVWWPLYLTRPMVGAILGFVLVVLFKAQLLTAGDAQPGSDSFWWLGVAIIGGFSTVDVTLRLRLAAKALFGSGEKK